MTPAPRWEPRHAGAGRLAGRVAIVSGGDSGIGRAVCAAFAREGANLGVLYLEEHEDARATAGAVEAEGRRAVLVPGDVGDERSRPTRATRARSTTRPRGAPSSPSPAGGPRASRRKASA